MDPQADLERAERNHISQGNPGETSGSFHDEEGHAEAYSSKGSNPSVILEKNSVTAEFNRQASAHIQLTNETLDAHLNVILAFSALFSAAISGVFALSWPLLLTSPNPGDQTNYLLQLLLHSNNSTLIPAPLPITILAPPTQAVTVNCLISASLICAILVSFGAVLAKQWLLFSIQPLLATSNSDMQQELQKKLDGGQRWYFQGIVETVLPSLLQVSLLMFIVGLLEFFRMSSGLIATVNCTFTVAAFTAIVLSVVCALYDPYCPFKTPLSESVFPLVTRMIIKTAWTSIWSIMTFVGCLLLSLLSAVTILTFAREIISCCWAGSFTEHSPLLPLLSSTVKFCWQMSWKYMKEIRRWTSNQKLEKAMQTMCKTSASKPAICGRSVVWMLSRSLHPKILELLAYSILEIQDSEFLLPLTSPQIFWLLGEKWDELRALSRHREPLMTGGSETEGESLGALLEFIEAVILHSFIALEQPTDEQFARVSTILDAKMRDSPPTDAGLWHHVQAPSKLQCQLDLLYEAASLKYLIAQRIHRIGHSPVFFYINHSMESLCLYQVTQETPVAHVTMVACAANLVPGRFVTTSQSRRHRHAASQRSTPIHAIIWRAYTCSDDRTALSNITTALNTYCDVVDEPHGVLPGVLAGGRIYASLLNWANHVVGSSISISLANDLMPAMSSAIHRILIVDNPPNVANHLMPLVSKSKRTKVNGGQEVIKFAAVFLMETLAHRLLNDAGTAREATDLPSALWPIISVACMKECANRRRIWLLARDTNIEANALSIDIYDTFAIHLSLGLSAHKQLYRAEVDGFLASLAALREDVATSSTNGLPDLQPGTHQEAGPLSPAP